MEMEVSDASLGEAINRQELGQFGFRAILVNIFYNGLADAQDILFGGRGFSFCKDIDKVFSFPETE
jgi:hypothetical protein